MFCSYGAKFHGEMTFMLLCVNKNYKLGIRKMFLERCFWFFRTKHRTCHFITKFDMYLKNLYICQQLFSFFLIFYFLIFIFRLEHVSSSRNNTPIFLCYLGWWRKLCTSDLRMGQKDSLMGSVVGWWLHEIQNLNILSFTAYLVLGPARQMRCTVPKKIVVYLYIVWDHPESSSGSRALVLPSLKKLKKHI